MRYERSYVFTDDEGIGEMHRRLGTILAAKDEQGDGQSG